MAYPSNSNRAKEAEKKKKTVKPVIKGGKTRKKSLLSRMEDTFIVEGAKEHIVGDLIIPAVKRTFLDMMGYLLGDDRPKSSNSKTSYGKYYQERNTKPTGTNGVVRGFTFDDVLVENRKKAEAVIGGMEDILREYPVVSVADLYELADCPTDNWTANKYGWTDIRNARIIRVSDGYIIRMPKPMPID